MMNHPVSTSRLVRALLACGIVAFMVAGYAWTRISAAEAASFHGTAYPDAPPAPEFTLTSHLGETVSLADHRGTAVLLFFGFTRCPDFCPLTLAKLRRVLDGAEIGPDRVRVLLVTVDPEYDTPERLAAYVERFGPSVTALTGTPEEITEVLGEYGAYAEPRHAHDGSETIAHTSLVFAIDPAGRLRALIHPEGPAELVAEDIQTLLRLRR